MQEKWELKTYCEILGVSENSSQHEIHNAYLKAKRLYSQSNPDLHQLFSPQEAQALDRLVEEAFAVLGSHSLRAFYQRKQEAASGVASHSLPTTPPATEVVEEGYRKTQFGTYKVDDEIESRLQQAQVFDGKMLSTIRNYKNISLEQLSNATKIKSTYIMAIEANNFNLLPAPVYTRGFIVQIAKALHLPAEEVASSYMCQYKSTHEQHI